MSQKPPGNISNFDIDKLLAKTKPYQGTFMRDQISQIQLHPKTQTSAVINLDDSSGQGTHWVAIVNDPKLPFIEYFDSYGFPPPLEALQFFRHHSRKPLFQDAQLQQTRSDYCGYFTAYYIAERAKGKSPEDVIYSLTQKPSNANEKMVTNYFFNKV